MGRYTGPSCRLCRRAGEKLLLKGERCFTPRCALERRRTPPGQHTRLRRRLSDRGIQLREKQKARYIYGIMERQFKRYMDEAFSRPGVTGQYLLQLLERRLDNVVYRLGFAESRKHARQLVRHGHFLVNGRKVDIPSYLVRVGDIIAWKESSRRKPFFAAQAKDIPRRPVPQWLALDTENMTGRVLRLPEPQDVDTTIDTRLIVEFYSR
jgi:small subunit ribosomal protein S4